MRRCGVAADIAKLLELLTPLPAALVCRRTSRLLCCPRPQRGTH